MHIPNVQVIFPKGKILNEWMNEWTKELFQNGKTWF